MSSKARRAVIIGAGLGGLAIALRLASRGWRVAVCERYSSPGGKMNRWSVNGFVFDTGPSLITMPHVFNNFFAHVGVQLQDHIKWLRVDPLARYHFPDGVSFEHTDNLPRWLQTVCELEPSGKETGFLEFMALGERLYDVSCQTFFRTSPFEKPDLHNFKVLPRLPIRRAWGRYHDSVEHFFKSPQLRQMFDRYMTYVGSSPYESPATLAVIPYIEFAFGVWHIQGGLYQLVELLCRLLRERKGEVLTNAPVVRIHCQDRRVCGVELAGGETLPAEVVVMNGDASRTASLLGQQGPQIPPRERSLSGFVMLFALRDSPGDLPHHSVYFSSDYRKEFHQLFRERKFPDDPTVYVNMPSRTDRSMTPGFGEVMFVMANAPADDEPWHEAKTAHARERVFQRLRTTGFPEFRHLILYEAVITPQDFATRFDMPGGAIYGQASHGWKGAFLRPPNRNLAVRGLYHVGGSTHPGGGTPTVIMSASITADLIEKYEA